MDPLMTLNADTFGSDVLAMVGIGNAFDDRLRLYPLAADLGKAAAADPRGRDQRYPRVSVDEVAARRPELIVLPDEPHAFAAADRAALAAMVPGRAAGRRARQGSVLVRRVDHRGAAAPARRRRDPGRVAGAWSASTSSTVTATSSGPTSALMNASSRSERKEVRLSTKDGMPTGALYVFARMLLRLHDDVGPERIAVVFDAGRKSFRTEIFPEYKANRPPAPEDLAIQMPRFAPLVEALGWPVLAIPGVEADDVVATLATAAAARGWECTIYSADKDLMQLVGEHTAVIDAMRAADLHPRGGDREVRRAARAAGRLPRAARRHQRQHPGRRWRRRQDRGRAGEPLSPISRR
jgi:hypothetical protein